jgi:hypothetical protein
VRTTTACVPSAKRERVLSAKQKDNTKTVGRGVRRLPLTSYKVYHPSNVKVVHNPEAKLITVLDERFYTTDNATYFPGVTTILDVYPKGYGFTKWLKNMGSNADQIVKEAAEQGSRIHDAIDRFTNGEEICWEGEQGSYTFDEWMMILKFKEFWDTYFPKVIAHEVSLVDSELGYGGTIDLICAIGDVVWMIDYKSSNYVHTTHELQLAAYRVLWNKLRPDYKVMKSGILHLKASTRGAMKDKMQGKGWKMVTFDRPYQDAFKLFTYTQALWKEENPNFTPKNEQYPDRIKLKVTKK